MYYNSKAVRDRELPCYHIDGAWLSLVERCVRDAEVAGSNPVASTLGRGAGAFEEIQMFRFFIVF